MEESKTPFATHVFVCQATREDGRAACGNRWDAPEAADAIKAALKERGVDARITRTGCLGPCAEGPNVMLYPGKTWLKHCHRDNLTEIVDRVADQSRPAGA